MWTSALVRYSPIGKPEFVNPPPLALPAVAPDQRKCTGCHTLPMVSRSYCDSVLAPAALFTMPAGFMFEPSRAAAGWPPSAIRSDYRAHIDALTAACAGAP